MFIITIAIIILLMFSVSLIAFNTKNKVKDLFKMNKELQEDNYYMAEFEFKMLGISYLLDKGHYYTALRKLNELHNQMETRQDLIKMPNFKTKEEEIEFYLSLQNPKTGAFMDDSYPLNTYHEPTENVLLHLDKLAQETNQTLKLKYPLKYLDNINTTEKLIPILNDWSTVGWLALKFPQTSFHNVRDLLSLARDKDIYGEDGVSIVEKYNLYDFSQEWKDSMLQWFYDYQDSETGTWGPKSKDGKLLKKDLSNTAPILKTFVDENGDNIYERFPLRYKNELFKTILTVLDKNPPKKEDLDEWHEWGLETPKGLRILTRYLWSNASKEDKEAAKILIENYTRIIFKELYIPKEGSFSYYPNSEHATIDGLTGLIPFRESGAFSYEKQIKLWGTPEENILDKGIVITSNISEKDFALEKNNVINSFRTYTQAPDYKNLNLNVDSVFYPIKTDILDVIDLIPKMQKWIDTTNQTMGNWVSKEEIREELYQLQIKEVSIYQSIPLDILNKNLNENKQIIIIGFDILQIPRYKITFKFKN
ncbi:MAG: hypothetical protein OQK82_01535 [Candidatus Pacearchaeota archaeon]|nr:hypothetical protein [Candidatus Pacearchaeota archaeon]